MPSKAEHLQKYKINKNILETVLDPKNKEHYDWIVIVCFYTALHIIEARFAQKSINNATHKEREDRMRDNPDFGRKIAEKYKQLSSYSKVARYQAKSMPMTLVDASIHYLQYIEDTLMPIIDSQSIDTSK